MLRTVQVIIKFTCTIYNGTTCPEVKTATPDFWPIIRKTMEFSVGPIRQLLGFRSRIAKLPSLYLQSGPYWQIDSGSISLENWWIGYVPSKHIVSKSKKFWLVWFFTSQSTAMVMSGWSVDLNTLLSWASLTKLLTSIWCIYFSL